MSVPTKVQLLVQSQLQEDWVAECPVVVKSAAPGLVTDADNSGRLVSYYVQDNKVFTAYRYPQMNGNFSPGWVVEDTKFPSTASVTPVDLRVTYYNGLGGCCVTCIGSDKNVYMLKTEIASRFYHWTLIPNKPTTDAVTEAVPFVTADNKLCVLVNTRKSDGKYAAYCLIPDAKGSLEWKADSSVRDDATSVVVDRALGSRSNETSWGYFQTAKDNGKSYVQVTTTTLLGSNKAVASRIATGDYYGLCHVRLPTNNTKPLLFGIDSSTDVATYFKATVDANGKRTTSKVNLFGSSPVTKIAACLRTGVKPNGVATEWVEVFGVDQNKRLIHTESVPDPDKPALTQENSSVYLLSTGEYAVNVWSDSAVITTNASDVSLTSAGDGYAAMLVTQTADTDINLLHMTQDPATTQWHQDILSTPATSTTTAATKKQVYYVEITAFDANGIRMPNLLATIKSIQYCNANINGISTSIDAQRAFTAVTNSSGKICITVDAAESLSAPTLTISVEGMDPKDVIDVHPSGAIQKILKEITADGLKSAKDKTDDTNVFDKKVTDDQLKEIAKALNTLMEITDPPSTGKAPSGNPSSGNSPSYLPKNAGTSQGGVEGFGQQRVPGGLPAYTHKLSNPQVARPRSGFDLSLGRINGNSQLGFDLKFRGDKIQFTVLKAQEAKNLSLKELDKLPKLLFSLGDLFNDVINGAASIARVVASAVDDAVDVVIQVTKNAVDYVVKGVIHFASQAFELAMTIFRTVTNPKKIFNWLFYQLPKVNHTAEIFRAMLVNFTDNANTLYTADFPKKAKDLADKAKNWLDSNCKTAEDHMKDLNVNSFDENGPKKDDNGTFDYFLDNLPSTATWLFNKFFNTDAGSASGLGPFKGLADFVTEWTGLLDDLNLASAKKELKDALQTLSEHFKELSTRSAVDGKEIGYFLEICKSVLYMIASIFKIIVDRFCTMAARAIASLKKFWDSELEIPILASIFKAVTGKKLRLGDVVTYILAIPFQIAYQSIQQKEPFAAVQVVKDKVDFSTLTDDEVNVSRGIMYGLYTFVDLYEDFIGANMPFNGVIAGKIPKIKENGPACIKSLLTGTGFFLCASQIIFESSSLPESFDRIYLQAGLGYSDLTFRYGFGLYHSFLKVSRGDQAGAVIQTLFGVAKLGPAIWHVVDVVNEANTSGTEVSGSAEAVLASEFLAPVSDIAKFLSLFRDPYTYAALFVCDSVSGVGASAARIAAAQHY